MANGSNMTRTFWIVILPEGTLQSPIHCFAKRHCAKTSWLEAREIIAVTAHILIVPELLVAPQTTTMEALQLKRSCRDNYP